MIISERGLDLIKDFEGYLRPLKDGGCIAYRCPAGVWTIGWGCTKGVKAGMTWTKQQAVEGLRRELAECEAAVTRMVTAPIHQHQFDALVSFAYNCGIGALQKSTILRKLNRGDVEGAAAAFEMWNKATVNGKRVVLRGLARRRAAEKALFLTPPDDAEPEPMAQKVEEPASVSPGAAAVGGTGLIGGGALLADPAGVTSTAVAVKANAGQLLSGVDLITWGVPVLIVAGVLAFLWWSRKP
jgi:lysozyme